MQFFCIGINYHTANTEIREKVAFQDLRKIDISNYLIEEGVGELVILSTCNRSEIYFYGNEGSPDIVRNFFENALSDEDSNKNIYLKKGIEAVIHLFNVAAGFDSLVIGEDQILGQVKEAHLLAMSIESSKKFLNKVFREAIVTAKKIKSELKISENPLSVGYIAIKYLKEKIGILEGKSVLVAGTGNMGKLALNYLLENKVKNIYATYRNSKSCSELEHQFPEIKFIDFKDRYEYLGKINVLISCTTSPHVVFDHVDITPDKILYIMDLAVPRDVDCRLGKLENIKLYNIDDLQKISDENYKIRKQLLIEGQRIIDEDVKSLFNWIDDLFLEPAIKSLNRVSLNVQEETMEYLTNKLELKQKDRMIIEKILNTSLNRIIKLPLARLNKIENSKKKKEYAKMLYDLFTLELEED